MPPSEPPKGTKSRARRKPPAPPRPRPLGQSHERPVPARRPSAVAGLIPGAGPVVRPSRPAQRPPTARTVQRITAGARPLARKPVRPKPIPQPKPLAPRPPRRVPVVVPTPDIPRDIRSTQREFDQAQRARRVAAAGKTGGDFTGSSARSGPNTDAAAARTARRIGHDIHVGPDGHYYAHVKRDLLPDRHIPIDPFTGKVDRRWQSDPRSGRIEEAAVQAPALKILDQTTRPIHAIAGAAKEDVKAVQTKGLGHYLVHGGGAPARKAAVRGAQLKDRTLFSDVLKQAGVKNKAVAAAGGFVLDVGLDPLTYGTGGTGSVAARAGATAARKVERKALKAGMSEAGARTVAARAAKQATAKAPRGKGVTVSLAGQEVPGVRRATAAVARGVRAPVRKVAPAASRTVPAKLRRGLREVAPRVRQAGVTDAEFTGARQAARRARAGSDVAEARATQLAQELRRKLSKKDYAVVADAIDRGKLSLIIGPNKKAIDKLAAENPREFARRKELITAAREARDAFRGARRVSRRAGVAAGHRAGDTSEFLTSADLKRLRRTVRAEPVAQARRVAQLQRHEQRAQAKAVLAEREGVLRAQGAQRVTETRAVGQARVAQAQEAGRARVATEKVRGREARRVAVERARAVGAAARATTRAQTREAGRAAVTREREIAAARAGVVEARRRLKAELARPVTKRRGVAALEAKVRSAESAWRDARRAAATRRAPVTPVTPRAVEPPAPVSAVRPRVAAPVVERAAPITGRRAGQAALRYEQRAGAVAHAEQRLAAAQRIPTRSVTESHEQYLRRLVKFADQHDLPLVKRRAEGLLARKPKDVARGYFPREFETRALKRMGLSDEEIASNFARGGGAPARTVGKTTAGFARGEKRTLRVVNPERVAAGKEPFSTNVPLIALNHLRSAARATSQGEFAKEMAGIGRQVRSADDLRPGEQLYKLGYRGGTFGLHAVHGLPTKPAKGGQYVALNQKLVDGMQDAITQGHTKTAVGRELDRATGGFKRWATRTPGFHVRNIAGDLQIGYIAQPGHRLPGNVAQAGRAVRRASEQARNLETPASHATIKVAGRRQSLDEFLKGARENGVLDTGVFAHDVRDVSGLPVGRSEKVRSGLPITRGRVGRATGRWMTNRENLMRLATYKAALDKGMKPADAADVANKFHIDYGDLSQTERVFLRRALPFYTWTARSLPVAAETLVTHPGKYANIEKAREEVASATDLNEAAIRRGMSRAIGRQAPFVMKIGKGAYGISLSLPVTLLNELPTSANFGDWIDEVSRFTVQMVNPIFKAPVEAYLNKSAYTKQDIENPRRPLTAAPTWVRWLPEWAKRDLEVTPNYIEKRTGKKTWGWRGRADWASRQVPGLLPQISAAASGGRPGQPKDYTVAALGLAGIRVDSLNAAAVKRTGEVKVLEELAKLNRQAAKLNQQGITSDNPTSEYKALRKRINALTHQVRPPKGKKRAQGALPLGGGSGGGKLPLGGGESGGKLPL